MSSLVPRGTVLAITRIPTPSLHPELGKLESDRSTGSKSDLLHQLSSAQGDSQASVPARVSTSTGCECIDPALAWALCVLWVCPARRREKASNLFWVHLPLHLLLGVCTREPSRISSPVRTAGIISWVGCWHCEKTKWSLHEMCHGISKTRRLFISLRICKTLRLEQMEKKMLLCTVSAGALDRFVHRRNRVVSRLQLKLGHGRQLRPQAAIHRNINLGMVQPARASSPACLCLLCRPGPDASPLRGEKKDDLPNGSFIFHRAPDNPYGARLCPVPGSRAEGCSLLFFAKRATKAPIPPQEFTLFYSARHLC